MKRARYTRELASLITPNGYESIVVRMNPFRLVGDLTKGGLLCKLQEITTYVCTVRDIVRSPTYICKLEMRESGIDVQTPLR
jgi:hypothetical protein